MTPGCCPAPDAPGPEGRDAEHCERHAHLRAPTVLHTAPRSSQRRMRKGFPQPCPAAMKLDGVMQVFALQAGLGARLLEGGGKSRHNSLETIPKRHVPSEVPRTAGHGSWIPTLRLHARFTGLPAPGSQLGGFLQPYFLLQSPTGAQPAPQYMQHTRCLTGSSSPSCNQPCFN